MRWVEARQSSNQIIPTEQHPLSFVAPTDPKNGAKKKPPVSGGFERIKPNANYGA